jgi:hypothetical protein
MSKIKLAQLEERTLLVSERLLEKIESMVDSGEFMNDTKKFKELVNAYNTLKPYF